MNKKIIAIFLITASVCCAKPAVYSANAEIVHPIVSSGFMYNKIQFEKIDSKDAPLKLIDTLKTYNTKRGFTFYYDKSSGYTYIGISMGEEPTGGYDIDVSSVDDNEGKTSILVNEKKPEPGSIVTQIVNYPKVIIRTKGITSNISVCNASGDYYSYFSKIDFSNIIIGVGNAQGVIKNIETKNNYVYITIQKDNEKTQVYHAPVNTIKNLSTFKIGDSVYVRYPLIPINHDGYSGFPINKIINANDWVNLNGGGCVPSDKSWKIKFKKDLSNYNINTDNIYIKDSTGNIVPTIITPFSDGYSINIKPVNNYKSGETYCLYISRNTNTNTMENYKMEFKIK